MKRIIVESLSKALTIAVGIGLPMLALGCDPATDEDEMVETVADSESDPEIDTDTDAVDSRALDPCALARGSDNGPGEICEDEYPEDVYGAVEVIDCPGQYGEMLCKTFPGEPNRTGYVWQERCYRDPNTAPRKKKKPFCKRKKT